MVRGYEAKSAETSPTMRAMSPRGRRRARSAAAGVLVMIVAACTSADGVSTDSASARTSAVAGDDDPDAGVADARRHRRRRSPTHGRRAPTRTGQLDRADDGGAAEHVADADPRFDRDVDRLAAHRRRTSTAARSSCRSTTTTRRLGNFELYLVRHRANDQDEQIGIAARQPGRPGLRRQRASRAGADFVLRPSAARPLRHRRLGPARHGRQRAGDRLHRRLRHVLHRRRHHARRRRGAPAHRRPGRGVRGPSASPRTATILQHVGTNDSAPRHGRHPPGARRGQDQLLRLQLRQRARRDVGDAVPRHRAGRRARRRQSTRTPIPSSWRSQQVAGFEAHARRVPRATCSADTSARSTTTATPSGAFDALMDDARRAPARRASGPARPSPAAWRCRPSAQAMYADALWHAAGRRPGRRPAGRRRRAADPLRRLLPPPARRHVAQPRSRRSR